MEDASSNTAQTIALTAELARDLQAVMAGKLPKKRTAADAAGFSTPRFGSVYFGPLDRFAGGDPHFGMVTDTSSSHRQPRPEVPFSPITTRKQTGWRKRQTVLLAPGTLPSASSHGLAVLKPSRILLYMPIPISLRQMRRLMDDGRMHFVQTLNESILNEARTILGLR
jgi:hypothetical protein